MTHPEWTHARRDIAFALEKAREAHDARIAALDLSQEQRKQIAKISQYLDKNFFSYSGRGEILSFYEEIASDLDPTPDVEDALWFLKDVIAFLPSHGRPPKEALHGAVFWLLLNYHATHTDDMGVGVGWSDNGAGTQNQDSNLVSFVKAGLIEAGIRQHGSPYQSSAVANAAKTVIASSLWAKALSKSTEI